MGTTPPPPDCAACEAALATALAELRDTKTELMEAQVIILQKNEQIEAQALDKLGTEVYNACDGKTGVRALMKRFGADHKLSLAEAEMSVTQYLKTLVSKGLIVIAIDREKKEPGERGA